MPCSMNPAMAPDRQGADPATGQLADWTWARQTRVQTDTGNFVAGLARYVDQDQPRPLAPHLRWYKGSTGRCNVTANPK